MTHTQATIVDRVDSTPANIFCGVPQGFKLGPLMILLYINNLKIASSFDVHIFADDACLLLDGKNSNLLEKMLIQN